MIELLIVSILAIVGAWLVLTMFKPKLHGRNGEFYFGLFTGLVVLGVTSLIGVVVVSLSITDEMDVCAALLPEPVPGEILTEVMIARFNEAGCADHSTRLMRPLIAGGGAMLLYFCAGLWTRLSYRKRKGGLG